ncbi:UDP-glucose 4-epimerase GalE [Rhizobium sp. RU36D]|uniref:UDP-glucose 4-epimerase GalE n=1 Tax=Rhizobium sp. RU36D TaxID=1907415 RepID=UPI000A061569|nr:UDP-glucose 4-epimerase GalE [Rhizobium sp. RU36D]
MTNKNVLVVGGAGYIGSHTCMELAARGYTPVVFDNLSNGHREFVRWGALEEGDIRDRARLNEVFEKYAPVAVVHFAGSIEVGQSTRDPVSFYDNNVIGSLSLLEATIAAGVKAFVFSSTCATYGLPESAAIDETHRQSPINPYGRTKLIVEQALLDYSQYCGLNSVILRYFNAAGADPQGQIGEWHEPETHVIPLAIDAALGRRPSFSVFGTDYDTRDGTCVRDYVHVLDLADAHVRALDYLLEGGDTVALNLGTGSGTTVKEVLDTVMTVSGRPITVNYADRRDGDSTVLVADSARARSVLGWQPRYSIEEIVQTAWKWHSSRNS